MACNRRVHKTCLCVNICMYKQQSSNRKILRVYSIDTAAPSVLSEFFRIIRAYTSINAECSDKSVASDNMETRLIEGRINEDLLYLLWKTISKTCQCKLNGVLADSLKSLFQKVSIIKVIFFNLVIIYKLWFGLRSKKIFGAREEDILYARLLKLPLHLYCFLKIWSRMRLN